MRLGVALCASLGLHVWLFTLLPSAQTSTPVSEQVLMLDLRQLSASSYKKPVTPTHQAQKKATTHMTKTTHKQIIQPKVLKKETVAQVETTQSELIEHTPVKSETAVAQSIPKDIRSQLLSHVQYPRQARRHAWQGRAELQLHIRQQNIDQVLLLTSTGYPILDRAAQHGLASIAHIPLSNGVYFMPVEFRLQ